MSISKTSKHLPQRLSTQERLAMRASHRAAMLGANAQFIKAWREVKTEDERRKVEEEQDEFILGYIPRPNW